VKSAYKFHVNMLKCDFGHCPFSPHRHGQPKGGKTTSQPHRRRGSRPRPYWRKRWLAASKSPPTSREENRIRGTLSSSGSGRREMDLHSALLHEATSRHEAEPYPTTIYKNPTSILPLPHDVNHQRLCRVFNRIRVFYI
jgi:hypothetical protein